MHPRVSRILNNSRAFSTDCQLMTTHTSGDYYEERYSYFRMLVNGDEVLSLLYTLFAAAEYCRFNYRFAIVLSVLFYTAIT